MISNLFKLLQLALCDDALCDVFPELSAEEWERIYNEAESFRGLNKILNEDAAKLTEFFKSHGRRSAVLKGQANARLYPNPFLKVDAHHAHMKNDRGVEVEVHFRTSSGNFNPFSTSRLLKFLDREILNSEEVPEGFCAHSVKFALAMQLSHIFRHFIGGGVGLRQIVDYYVLLRHSCEDDRAELAANLNCLGLRRIAGALMWLLCEAFGLDESLMLCKPDEFRGEWLLREIVRGGNFGLHGGAPQVALLVARQTSQESAVLAF